MTQTLPLYTAPTQLTGPVSAMVVHSWDGQHKLHLSPMHPVEEARDVFGGTTADALLFVEGVNCNACGTEAMETRNTSAFARECRSCGTSGCACIVVADEHADGVFWCLACHPQCMCRECAD